MKECPGLYYFWGLWCWKKIKSLTPSLVRSFSQTENIFQIIARSFHLSQLGKSLIVLRSNERNVWIALILSSDIIFILASDSDTSDLNCFSIRNGFFSIQHVKQVKFRELLSLPCVLSSNYRILRFKKHRDDPRGWMAMTSRSGRRRLEDGCVLSMATRSARRDARSFEWAL